VLINPLKGLLGGSSIGKSEEQSLFSDGLGETHFDELLSIFLVNISTDRFSLFLLFLLFFTFHLLVLKLLSESKRLVECFLLFIAHRHI
jgi:hypothetical protein